MIYLMTGKDDFSKREFFEQLKAKEAGADVLIFEGEGSSKDILQATSEQGLFSSKKLFKITNFFSGVNEDFQLDAFLAALAHSGNTYVFIEDALDKRKKQSKAVTGDKRITAKDFVIPSGPAFSKWVGDRAATYKATFAPKALEQFLSRLGMGQGEFGDELYDLWQADSELQKLATYAAGNAITTEDVAALVSENIAEDIFAVTNAIANRNRPAAITSLVNYMDRLPGNDEKAKIISISGVLAEQFRGVLVVQGMAEQRVPDAAIASDTGYTPGRIFMYKKIAKQFSQAKLISALQKLEILDTEIKTGSSPAALQFLMIVQSALQ